MKRYHLVFSLLLLFFLVSTSNGFASVSAVQEKLREIQLKLISEKIKLIQGNIVDLGKKRSEQIPAPIPVKAAPVLTREELAASLKEQIVALEQVVVSLRPKVIEEGVTRIEKRIAEINEELKTADTARVRELQVELTVLAVEYSKIQQQISATINDAIKERQATILREQIRLLEEKVRTLPRPVSPSVVSAGRKESLSAIQDQIEKIRLKILQAQMKSIQEKIQALRNQ